MFYPPFWILLVIVVVITVLTLYLRKPGWVDMQAYIMIITLTMSSDMLFCKQFSLYHYVSIEFRGWYSFWANLIIVPSLGLIFIKFLPLRKKFIYAYIALWTIGGTLFELFITEPFGIVQYTKWHILPNSIIGSAICFSLVYFYHCFLKRLLKPENRERLNS